jgi:hypothetical protein
MTVRSRLWWLALALVVVLAALALLVVNLGRAPAPTPLPSPNGYDDFLKAGAAVTGSPGDYGTLDHEALRTLVAANAEPLRLLRLGLTRQCALPAEAAMANSAGMLNDLAGMKRLVQLLAAEGRLRELDNQPAEAAQSCVDAIRFGNEVSRGGFLITHLVGVACEAIGRAGLAKSVPALSPREARPIVTELETVEKTRVTFDEVLRGERRYFRHEIRKLPNPIVWIQAAWSVRPAKQRALERHNRNLAQTRLLTAELALRCYIAERGRTPAGLADLVPGYLSNVPLDPYTKQAMIYRPAGTNWLLYSVGSDGVDNEGKPVTRGTSSPGDLLYNAP